MSILPYKTLFDKIWNTHVIAGQIGEPQLLYVDLHLIHEVTSPQPFDGLRSTNRRVRRPDLTFATMDHNVPTKDIFNIQDQMSRLQMDTLAKNTKEFDIPGSYFCKSFAYVRMLMYHAYS